MVKISIGKKCEKNQQNNRFLGILYVDSWYYMA